jgi:hypothetical protein
MIPPYLYQDIGIGRRELKGLIVESELYRTEPKSLFLRPLSKYMIVLHPIHTRGNIEKGRDAPEGSGKFFWKLWNIYRFDRTHALHDKIKLTDEKLFFTKNLTL